MMNVDPWYLKPSDERVAALTAFAVEALTQWGVTNGEPELFLEGENAVFRAELADIGLCAVRVHRTDYHTADHLQSQVDWSRALARDGVVHTPDVIDTTAGESFVTVAHPDVPEPRFVSVLRWEPGEPLTAAGTATAATYHLLGQLMAGVHNHGRTWPGRATFTGLRWDAGSFVGDNANLGPFWNSRMLDADERTMMVEFRQLARRALDELGTDESRFGIVHGDFLPQNLLLRDDMITVLDFDDCGHGWYLMEIATALMGAAGLPDYSTYRDALITGYRTRHPISSDDLELLPLLLALRTATYVGWVETRAHTPAARERGAAIVRRGVTAVRRYLDRIDE